MPPTSKKLTQLWRSWGGILVLACPCVRVSVTLCIRSRTVRDRMYGLCMKNERTRIFFFSVRLVFTELCPFFDWSIVNLWNLVNKISGEPFELGSWYLANRLCPKFCIYIYKKEWLWYGTAFEHRDVYVMKYLAELSPFSNFVILCSRVTLSTKYLENHLS